MPFLLAFDRAADEFAWDKQEGRSNGIERQTKRQIADLDSKVALLGDHLVASDAPRIVEAYEKPITDMEKNKLFLAVNWNMARARNTPSSKCLNYENTFFQHARVRVHNQ
ncbi:hypothetical protein [Ruegeria pomeroyi]|uniref:Uncharacterized protein n=1 Tax=Ruegeria pomeroyi TaxID=89184 RepID=A0A850LJ53_9RHOB|nr:hypothetical protein [Ruegeria pomeroyi]NVK98111.1 hypothetical protein [Ruegeria pomeroyi]NVL02706.1 hypothetical protein [Ruegeria pomeroyi]HCE71167.1 hypothetical protein [Ruegeria sp.]